MVHSKLLDTAVLSLRTHQNSLTALLGGEAAGERLDSVLQFLKNHSARVSSISLATPTAFAASSMCSAPVGMLTLRELPPSPQLRTLVLEGFDLQLQPGSNFPGVLTSSRTASLTQLQLNMCRVLDDGHEKALATTMSHLPPGLQHLSICLHPFDTQPVRLCTGALRRLQQLTALGLGGVQLEGPDDTSPVLQPLHNLTRLADLQLRVRREPNHITTSILSGTHSLTRLVVSGEAYRGPNLVEWVEPGVLAGKTLMQHLDLAGCHLPGGAAGVTQLLLNLQHLQHLTHLDLGRSLKAAISLPAAAFAALTTSSKLQYLHISGCTLPAGTWQHIFPAGRWRPRLQSLKISSVRQLGGSYATAPEASRLSSCCPGLQPLDMVMLQSSAEPLAPLQGLRRLRKLRLHLNPHTKAAEFELQTV